MTVSIATEAPQDLDRLALTIALPDGSLVRWAGDESDTERIPQDLTFSSSIPGGDADLNCQLLRDMRRRLPDLDSYNEVRAYGPGNESRWRGALIRTPDTPQSVSPAAIGDSSRLKEDPSFRLLAVYRDLSGWEEMSAAKKIQLGVNYHTTNGEMRVESAGFDNPDPGIVHTFNRLAANAAFPFEIIQSVFDTGGIPIGEFRGSFATLAGQVAGVVDWDQSAALYSSAGSLLAVAGSFVSTNQAFAPSSTNDAATVAALTTIYKGTFTGDGTWSNRFYDLVLFGRQVPKVLDDTTGKYGVAGDAVIKAILDGSSTGISYSSDSIAASDFIIPHLAWLEPTTPEQAILDTNRFFRNIWAVYDRKLLWRPPESFGRLWRVRRDEGANVQSAGPDAEQDFNGVVVRYDDPLTGQQEVIGPVASGLAGPLGLDRSQLVDSNPDAPLNKWGRRRWGILEAGKTSEPGAIRLGQKFLEATSARQASGSIEIVSGQAIDEIGSRHPASAPRAGDRLLVEDQADATERLIVEANYVHATRSATLTLDSPAAELDAILERLAVVLVGVTD